jgi:hypothetical protein
MCVGLLTRSDEQATRNFTNATRGREREANGSPAWCMQREWRKEDGTGHENTMLVIDVCVMKTMLETNTLGKWELN